MILLFLADCYGAFCINDRMKWLPPAECCIAVREHIVQCILGDRADVTKTICESCKVFS